MFEMLQVSPHHRATELPQTSDVATPMYAPSPLARSITHLRYSSRSSRAETTKLLLAGWYMNESMLQQKTVPFTVPAWDHDVPVATSASCHRVVPPPPIPRTRCSVLVHGVHDLAVIATRFVTITP